MFFTFNLSKFADLIIIYQFLNWLQFGYRDQPLHPRKDLSVQYCLQVPERNASRDTTKHDRTQTIKKNELREFLTTKGYSVVQLRKNGLGLLIADVTLQGKRLNFLVDTGSTNSHIESAAIIRHGIKMDKALSGTPGNSLKTEISLNSSTKIPSSLIEIKLSEHNQAFAVFGEKPIEGIIGQDILNSHTAIIDTYSEYLYLRLPVRNRE